jgi:hypothetical protein
MNAAERMAKIEELKSFLAVSDLEFIVRYCVMNLPGAGETPVLKIDWSPRNGVFNEVVKALLVLVDEGDSFIGPVEEKLGESIRGEAREMIRFLQAEAREEFAAATGLDLEVVTRALEGQLERERQERTRKTRKH